MKIPRYAYCWFFFLASRLCLMLTVLCAELQAIFIQFVAWWLVSHHDYVRLCLSLTVFDTMNYIRLSLPLAVLRAKLGAWFVQFVVWPLQSRHNMTLGRWLGVRSERWTTKRWLRAVEVVWRVPVGRQCVGVVEATEEETRCRAAVVRWPVSDPQVTVPLLSLTIKYLWTL